MHAVTPKDISAARTPQTPTNVGPSFIPVVNLPRIYGSFLFSPLKLRPPCLHCPSLHVALIFQCVYFSDKILPTDAHNAGSGPRRLRPARQRGQRPDSVPRGPGPFRRFPAKVRFARGNSSQSAFGEGRFLTNRVSRGGIPNKVRLAREIPRFSHLARLARLTFAGKSLAKRVFPEVGS